MFNTGFRQDANPNVYSFARGDVNGDRIPDNIYLTGIKTADSPFVQNITLMIQDGRTGMLTSVPLKENAGYDPFLSLNDFTGDGVNEIFIGIFSGGSGGMMYYYIYSFLNNIAKLIFDFAVYNEEYQYGVTYKDNYKAEVVSRKNNTTYIIDLAYKGADYLNEIYDSGGKLKSPISGFVNPISGLYPIDYDADKAYELLAYQRIAGRYNADPIGYVMNILKWNGNMFVLEDQNVAIFGAYRF